MLMIIALASVITGCCKQVCEPKVRRQKNCERVCHHLKKDIKCKVREKVAKRQKCKKCCRHECVCHDRHDDHLDEMVEYRSFDFK